MWYAIYDGNECKLCQAKAKEQKAGPGLELAIKLPLEMVGFTGQGKTNANA
jgi:hypothetical protein